MVSDAESHADEDRKAKELAEARNVAEQAVYQGEKQLEELGEQVDDSSKSKVSAAIEELKGVLNSTDVDEIKAKTAALEAAFHKVSEQIYANAQAQGGDGGGAVPARRTAAIHRTPRRRSWTPRSSRTSSGKPAMDEIRGSTGEGTGAADAAPVAEPEEEIVVDAEVVEDDDVAARPGGDDGRGRARRAGGGAARARLVPRARAARPRRLRELPPARRRQSAEAERRGKAAVARACCPRSTTSSGRWPPPGSTRACRPRSPRRAAQRRRSPPATRSPPGVALVY